MHRFFRSTVLLPYAVFFGVLCSSGLFRQQHAGHLAAMPDLIRLVHGNVLGLQHIIKEFVSYWKRHDTVDPPATGTEADV